MTQAVLKELEELGFLSHETLSRHPALLDTLTAHHYEPGDIIYYASSESDLLFIVREGLVKLLNYLPNGRTRIVRLHKRGALLGLEGLIEQEHEHTAIALDKVKVFQIPVIELKHWKENQPQLYSQLIEKWHEYLGYADTWITDFSTGNIKGRVSRLIRFLIRFDTDTGPQVVELPTTEEMAEILGVTPESVSRIIAEYKRDGVLDKIENNSESLFSVMTEKIEEYCQQ